MVSCFSPTAEKEVPGGLLLGADQIAAFVAAFWEAFPDVQLTVTSEVEEGPVVAVRGTLTGTPLGVLRTPAGNLPPPGRRLELRSSHDDEVQGGVLVAPPLRPDRRDLRLQLVAAARARAPA